MAEHMITLQIGGKTKKSRFEPKPVALDWNALPDASQAFVIAYGLRQYLQDGMAGAESQAEAHGAVEDRVKKLQSGDLARTKGEAKAKPDTVESRAIKLAVAFIRSELQKANAKAEAATIREAAVELVVEDPKYKAEAKKQLDAEGKLKEGTSEKAASIIGNLLAKVGGNAETDEEDEETDETDV